MKGVLKAVEFLLKVNVTLMFLSAAWAFALDQIDGYRWRKAKRSA